MITQTPPTPTVTVQTAPKEEISQATILNHGFGLPAISDTVLLDGEKFCDAIFIRRIVSVASPTPARDGTLWQPNMIVEGSVIRCVAVEMCVSEYIATARLIR